MYERYEQIRKARGYTDAQVADATGVGRSTFSDWKKGRFSPRYEKIIKIAEFLGCKPSDIRSMPEISLGNNIDYIADSILIEKQEKKKRKTIVVSNVSPFEKRMRAYMEALRGLTPAQQEVVFNMIDALKGDK